MFSLLADSLTKQNRIRLLDITTALSPLHLFQSLAQQHTLSNSLQNPRQVLSCIVNTFEQPTSRSLDSSNRIDF